MLMKGDLNKVLEQVNGVLEGAFKRIEALEDRLMRMEGLLEEQNAPKRRGRPPGSKNKAPEEKKVA